MATMGLPALASSRGQTKLTASQVTENDTKLISDAAWTKLIGLIAGGVKSADASKSLGISIMSLEGTLRTDSRRKDQWDEARLASIRQVWDQESLDDALASIASGSTVSQACAAAGKKGHERQLYALVLKDPVVKTLYEEARMIQAEKMAIDDLIEISDDDSQDETWDGKSNSAAVNRSRLKVDSRKWIASKMHYKRFGDKIQQDIDMNVTVDHAARLDAARKRKEAAHKQQEKVINPRVREEKIING